MIPLLVSWWRWFAAGALSAFRRRTTRGQSTLRERALLGWRCARRSGGSSGHRLGLLLLLPTGAFGHEAHLDLALDHLDNHRVAGTVLEAKQLLAQRLLDD